MAKTNSFQQLASRLRGPLLLPGDGGYEDARRIFNAMIDRRPAAIARCTGAVDVIECVRFAREQNLLVSVRGGGHSIAGKAVCDDGLMIDLSQMKGIRVDPASRSAQAQPGLRLGELDRETQAFGLATPLGVVTNTGIAGLTLGGGIGWLNGKFGLACDNVESFDLVTAEGRLVRASAVENADLYWGLRGGSGNFGVVTSFEYRLHPVGTVLGGMVLYPAAKAKAVLRSYFDFCLACPDELSLIAGMLTGPDGNQVAAIAVCYCGELEQGEKLLQPLRSLARPVADLIQPMPYVAQQALLDPAAPHGHRHYWKSSFARGLNDEALGLVQDFMARKPSPATFCYLQHVHGAAARVGVTETAFSHRGDGHDFAIITQWPDPADDEKNIAWARSFFGAMEPHLEAGVYVNNLGEEGGERVRAAYGPNYERLAALKQKYDRDNFFRLNQNIAPAPAVAG